MFLVLFDGPAQLQPSMMTVIVAIIVTQTIEIVFYMFSHLLTRYEYELAGLALHSQIHCTIHLRSDIIHPLDTDSNDQDGK